MEPYQQRVIDERRELFDRLEKLKFFIDGKLFIELPESEKIRMKLQADYMAMYLSVLDERILNFGK